jgi:hypothetical protein
VVDRSGYLPELVSAAALVPPQTASDSSNRYLRVLASIYAITGTRGTPQTDDRNCFISGR